MMHCIAGRSLRVDVDMGKHRHETAVKVVCVKCTAQ